MLREFIAKNPQVVRVLSFRRPKSGSLPAAPRQIEAGGQGYSGFSADGNGIMFLLAGSGGVVPMPASRVVPERDRSCVREATPTEQPWDGCMHPIVRGICPFERMDEACSHARHELY